MPNSKLDLPGKWEPSKRYLVKGATLIAWAKALQADRALPGPGIYESQTPEGRMLSIDPQAASQILSSTGAFFGMYLDNDGNTLLQGGAVTAGGEPELGTYVFADISVLEPGPSVGDLAGNYLWIAVTGNGVVTDGVLMGGFNLTAAATGIGTSMPSNTLPTAASAIGKICYILIGQWTSTTFLPSSPGNKQISFCPGTGYTIHPY